MNRNQALLLFALLATAFHATATERIQLEIVPLCQFKSPVISSDIYQMVLADNNQLYYTALLEKSLRTVKLDGSERPAIGRAGSGPNEFNLPMALTYEKPYLYVLDNGNRRLYKIDTRNDSFVQTWSFRPANALLVRGTTLTAALSEEILDGEANDFCSILDFDLEADSRDLTSRKAIKGYYFKNVCCLKVQGTKRAALLYDREGALWCTYTGAYRLEKYQGDKLVKNITKVPLAFAEPQPKKINRFDRKAMRDFYVSFDKMGALLKLDDKIILYRFKSISDAYLDVYSTQGQLLYPPIKIQGIVPFGSKDGRLLGYRENAGETSKNVEVVAIGFKPSEAQRVP